MNRPTKSFALEGVRYQTARLDASTGSWILMLMMEMLAALPQQEPPPPTPAGAAVVEVKAPTPEELYDQALNTATFMLRKFTRAQLAEVTEACLLVCSRMDQIGGQEVALPVVPSPGRFDPPSLQWDAQTVTGMVRHAIAFNICPTSPVGE